jgi:hypothetical protein
LSKKKRFIIIILCSCALVIVSLSMLVHYAPRYLLFNEPPRKSDCIIPLLGNEYLDRKKAAYKLISEGYSKVLLVPPRYRLVRVTDEKQKVPVQVKEELSELSIRAYKADPQFRWHENTHIELILAKEYMMAYGFNSAIVVSSPYHMRRVKLLAGYVFPESRYSIVCVPDQFESTASPWWSRKESFMWVAREYMKIGWLLVYHRFSELLTSVSDLASRLLDTN